MSSAPRLTPGDLEAEIAGEHYFTAFDGALGALSETDADPVSAALNLPVQLNLITFCVLLLKNGTKIVGINYGPISPENFDTKIARDFARAAAIEQLWPLLGFRLRDQLTKAG